MDEAIEKSALAYHRLPRPGKVEVVATKPLGNQRDLALAYSPGVAAACEAITAAAEDAALYTNRANLVGVITNGSAVLGLGNIGPLASKPVMEGKAVLFKKFAGVDVFDLEIDEPNPERLVEIIASLEPTLGGINLEDIRAPHCFYVEQELRRRMNIPVFHDDQHGTAIIVAAAALNGLRLVGRRLEDIRLVCVGAGAAGISCLRLLKRLGLKRENIVLVDRPGVIHVKRSDELDPYKREFATTRELLTLADAMHGAHFFLGLSGPGVLKQEMVRSMADKPLIFALANPIPEILPEEVYAVRPDAIVATGRSDYPNQVNNVLGFPYIFRGALDVGATTINEAMVEACVHALAELATEEAPDTVLAAYGDNDLKFGRDYLIPKPLDPRLITKLAPAVAQAAMDSGVATRPLQDVETYRHSLSRYVYATILVMRPLFERARRNPKRLIYADGEHPQVLRAVQAVVDEGMAEPMVIGNPERVAAQLQHIGLRIRPGKEVQIIDPAARAGSDEQAEAGHTLNTLVGARLLAAGEAGGLICGLSGNFRRHLAQVQRTLGTRGGIRQAVAMDVVVLKRGAYFFCDTGVREHPDSHDLAEIMLLAAAGVRRFGITPRLAVLSSANPPWHEGQETEDKLRAAVSLVRRQQPELQVEGPMRAETALSEPLRRQLFPDSNLQGEANLFVLPDLVAARIACDLVKMLGDGVAIGPILLGLDHPVHILAASSTVRRIVNATAIAVVDAQAIEAELPDQTLA